MLKSILHFTAAIVFVVLSSACSQIWDSTESEFVPVDQPAWMAGGLGDGIGRFRSVGSATIDSNGSVIVLDNQLRRLTWFDLEGQVEKVLFLSPEWGTPALTLESPEAALKEWPTILRATAASEDALYVADQQAIWAIRGETVQLLTDTGFPLDVAAMDVLKDGRIVVLAEEMVYLFAKSGEELGSWPVSSDHSAGARILSVGPRNQLYLWCSNWGQVVVFTVDGAEVRRIGSGGDGPNQIPGGVRALAVDSQEFVYLWAAQHYSTHVFGPDGTLLARWGSRGSRPGQAIRVRQLLADHTRHRLILIESVNHRLEAFDLTGEDQSARDLVKHSPEHPPTARPDHLALALDRSPLEERNLTWRTSPESDASIVEWLRVPEEPLPADPWDGPEVQRSKGSSEIFFGNVGPYVAHEVSLTGLEPGAHYIYRAGDGSEENWSDVQEFRMPDPANQDMKVLVLGDSRNRMEVWRQIIHSGATEDPDFIINTGDLVANGDNVPDWDAWFHEAREILSSYPLMPCLGNHENYSPNYFLSFGLPDNGPPGLEERCYSFDYGPAHWVVLDTGEELDKQAEWLEKDLQSADKNWTFVFYHRPAWAGHPSRGDGNLDVREAWAGLFEEYGVDIAWQGHDHYYFRTKPIRGGEVVAPGEAPIYVTTGGSGAPLYPIAVNQFAEVAESVDHYCIMHLSESQCRITVVRADGSLLDEFSISPRTVMVGAPAQ